MKDQSAILGTSGLRKKTKNKIGIKMVIWLNVKWDV